ncbi:MAG: Ig-like domain-containing protein, partial [Firmicutes bacterium]|nr:Ig-like domain-containing protein [Bacillota bacterium]
MKRLKTLTLAILLVAFASVALLGCGLFQWWDNGNNNGNGNNGYYNGYCNDNEAIDVPVHTVTARGAMTAYVNEYVSFMATVLPSNATNREVTWVVVGDGAGATISSDGVFRASTEGVFTVVATAGGVSGSTL